MEQNRVKETSEGVVKFSVVSELSIGAQISLCTGFSGFWLCPHKTRAARATNRLAPGPRHAVAPKGHWLFTNQG